jgi:putative ABC transport system permease protein
MGTNLLIIMPGSSAAGGARGGFGSQPTLTWDDLEALRTQLPSVRAAAPEMRSNTQVLSEDQNWTTSVIGTTPDDFDIRSWKVASGAFFSEADNESGAKVAVLGQTVVDKLFGPGVNPVGQVVRIKKVPFRVVGVPVRKGQSPMGQDYDDTIFVPAQSFRRLIQSQSLGAFISGTLFVQANGDTAQAQQDIIALLRERHHLADEAPNDFDVRNLSEIASSQEESTRTLSLLLAAIAAVSLVVGGIGIMNIMLVSVTERTREIGVRVAVGATPRDILVQFLIESLTLAVIGGFIGAGLGMGVARALAAQFHWPMLVRPEVILLSVGFSGLVGVVFGLYPARKASRLDPIDALRYE